MFVELYKMSEEFLALIDPAQSLLLVLAFKSVVVVWFALWVMFVGFNYVWGSTVTPIRDIVKKFLIYSAISAFAFNIGAWYGLSVSIIKEFSVWASGDSIIAMFTLLDMGTWRLSDLSQVYIKNDKSYIYHFEALFGTFLVHLAYYGFGLVASIILIYNSLALKLLIFTLPFAVTSLFFSLTKDIFSKWVQLLIANILSLIFISIFFKQTYLKVMEQIKLVSAKGNLLTITTSAFEIVSFLILGIFFLLITVHLSERLSSASVDRAVSSTAKKTALAGAGAGYLGAKAMGTVTRKGLEGTQGTINAVSAASTIAGNSASSAHALHKASRDKSSSATLRANRTGGINTSNSGGGGGSSGRATYRPVPLGGVASSKARNSGGSGNKSGSTKWGRIGAINKHRRNT
ncbi:MAG: type IV secretion system protein [Sulfurovum sp.]|nr:type IV secretion system protein [Sulfurovum sp.]